MELGFNLLFALITVCAFALWTITGPRQEVRCQHGLLLICALAILFPFISISDDLYSAPDIVEGTIVSVNRVSLSVACKEVFLAAPLGRYEAPVIAVSGCVTWDCSPHLPAATYSSSNGLRSPPLS